MRSTKILTNPYSLYFPPFIIGMLFLIIGIITYFNLVKEINLVNTFLGGIFMLSGVLEILFTIQNKIMFSNWKWSFSFGIMTYIIGILLISEPIAAYDITSFYIGVYFIFRAIFSINFGIEIFEKNNSSAYIIIGLAFLLILYGTSLVWLPNVTEKLIPFLDGTSFLITGFLIFYIYNSLRKSNQYIDYQLNY